MSKLQIKVLMSRFIIGLFYGVPATQ